MLNFIKYKSFKAIPHSPHIKTKTGSMPVFVLVDEKG